MLAILSILSSANVFGCLYMKQLIGVTRILRTKISVGSVDKKFILIDVFRYIR